MSCMFGVPRFRDHGECTLGFVTGLPETLNPKPETLNPTDTKRTSLSDKPVGGGSMKLPDTRQASIQLPRKCTTREIDTFKPLNPKPYTPKPLKP